MIIYFFFHNKQDYYRCCTFLFTGMTIFLIVSTLWPNGHHLRPYVMPRDNIFTQMITRLYKTDTSTNTTLSDAILQLFVARPLKTERALSLFPSYWLHPLCCQRCSLNNILSLTYLPVSVYPLPCMYWFTAEKLF